MPIISQADATTEVGYPGVERAVLVDATQGALSLYISHLEIGPGGRVTTHIHPDSEEAMVIVEGSLEAILGDQVLTLGEGDTVLAPAGVCRYTSATWKSDLEVGSPPTSTPTAKRPWSSWRAVWKQFWVTRYLR